jgi:acyl-coenzyme A synthetase/AMP-(fatty) acid ligase
MNLDSVLYPEDRVFVVQDGESVTRGAIRSSAAKLRETISAFSPCRVALPTQRVGSIMAALVASQSVGCDLLLLRDQYPYDDPVWSSWKVSVVLDEELSVAHSFPWRACDCGPNVLLTTSGTTGKPKVALWVLSALLGRVSQSRVKLESARWLLTFHPASFAGFQVLLTALVNGSELAATRIPMVANLAEIFRNYQPTHVSGTPTFWRGVLLALGSRSSDLSLEQITIGGEAVDQTTLGMLQGAFPTARITHIYASTEAGALFAVKDGQAGFPAFWLDEGIEGVGLRIRDGVLQVLSPRAMKKYLGAETSNALTEDGWMVTGDLVETVGDRVFFRGRVDNVINVGGGKVTPEEVEAVLLRMPIVKEARVFGQRNPMTGAVVVAEVVVSPSTDQDDARRAIYSFASQYLESFKIPRIVKFVQGISINSSGKKNRQS